MFQSCSAKNYFASYYYTSNLFNTCSLVILYFYVVSLQLEEHLFGDDRPVPKDVYARLKSLEERVLYLEGVSPEYFLTAQIAMAKMSKQREEESDAKMRATQNDDEVMTSLTNINKRIQELRSSLLVDKKSGIKMEQ